MNYAWIAAMSLARSNPRFAPCLLVLALFACTDDDASVADAGGKDNSVSDTGAPTHELSELHGDIDLELVAYDKATDTAAHTTFSAKLRTGALPAPEKWLETQRIGDCVLYEPNSPFCEPKCASGSVCVSTGKCEDSPDVADVGTVTLAGLSDTPITTKLIVTDHQLPAGTMLPYPPCAPGDQVKVSATGGDYPAFSLVVGCMSPLELATESVVVEKDSAVSLAWTKPDAAAKTRILVSLDISSHAGSYGKVTCETDDDGALDIAEPLITRLLELGYAGGPTIFVTRESRGERANADLDNVAFTAMATLQLPVEIPGLVSCVEKTDCPDGQACQWDKQCK